MDIVLLCIIGMVTIVLFALPFLNLGAFQNIGDGMQVRITTEQGDFMYPLHIERTLSFEGPVGITSIKIFDSKVVVLASPGRKQICVNAGYIERNGQWLACLPNRIFLRVFGSDNNINNSSQNIDIDGMVF